MGISALYVVLTIVCNLFELELELMTPLPSLHTSDGPSKHCNTIRRTW